MSDELIELPESWQWVLLESVASAIDPQPSHRTPPEFLQGVPYIGIGDINDDETIDFDSARKVSPEVLKEHNERYTLQTGDFIFGKIGTLGKPFKLPTPFNYTLSANVILLQPKRKFLADDWLFYFMRSCFVEGMLQQDSRATSQAAFGIKKIRLMPVPLPPLNEQKRIVSKIEELRDRSHRAKQALEAIPELCDRFRQSVLAAAFRGDLTADWREENSDVEPASSFLKRKLNLADNYQRLRKQTKEGFTNLNKCFFPELPETWQYATVQTLYDLNFIIDYADGNHGSLYPRKEEFDEEGVLYVTASQIANGKVDFLSCPRLNAEKASQLVKGWAQGGDVLLTHNATVGRTALVEDEAGSFLLGTSVTFYRTNPLGLNNKFFYLLLESQLWQQQLHAVMAQTTRNQVSIQKQAFFLVPVPPIDEQLEVVKQVQSFLTIVQRVEQHHEETEANFSHLNQSILAKAFRGELVEQDPNDEPASILLDRIRAERQAQEGKKSGGTRGKRKKESGDQVDLPGMRNA